MSVSLLGNSATSPVTTGFTIRRKRKKKRSLTNEEAHADNEEFHADKSRPNGQVSRPAHESNNECILMNGRADEHSEEKTSPAEGEKLAPAKSGYWLRLREQRRQDQLRAMEGSDAPPLPFGASPPALPSVLGVTPFSPESAYSRSSAPSTNTPPPSFSKPILGRAEETRQLAELAKTGLTPEQRDAARERRYFIPHGETIPFMGSAGKARPRFFPNKTLINSPGSASPQTDNAALPAPSSSAALQNAVSEGNSTPCVRTPVSSDDYARSFLDQGQTGPASAGYLHTTEAPRFPPGLGIGIELPPALRIKLGAGSTAQAGASSNAPSSERSKGKGKAPQTPRILLSPVDTSSDVLLSPGSSESSERASIKKKTRRDSSPTRSAASSDFAMTRQDDDAGLAHDAAFVRLPHATQASTSMTIRLPGSEQQSSVMLPPFMSTRSRFGPAGWRAELRSETQALNIARRHLLPTPSLRSYIQDTDMRRWHALHRDLRRQIINRNPPASAVPCVVSGCTAVLPSPISWLDHIENAHFKCVQCDRVSLNRQELDHHIRTAPHHFVEMTPHAPVATEPSAPVTFAPVDAVTNNIELLAGWDHMDEDRASSVGEELSEDLVPYCDACDLIFSDFARLQDHLDFAEAHQEPADASAEPVVSPRSRTRAPGVSAPAPISPAPVARVVAPALKNRPSAASIVAGKKRGKTDEERCPWPIPCAICLEVCDDITTTLCGHVGCRRCLQMAVARSLSCPTCRRDTKLSDLHPLYLPGSLDFPPLKAK